MKAVCCDTIFRAIREHGAVCIEVLFDIEVPWLSWDAVREIFPSMDAPYVEMDSPANLGPEYTHICLYNTVANERLHCSRYNCCFMYETD